MVSNLTTSTQGLCPPAALRSALGLLQPLLSESECEENAGFKEFQSAGIVSPWWIRVGSRMAFNFEAVEDANFEWLVDSIGREVEAGEFLFHFVEGTAVDIELCRRILELLGKDDLTPVPRRILPKR